MNLLCVVLFCAILSLAYAGWLTELVASRGLDMGGGVTLRLDNVKRKNGTALERHALRLDFASVGVSLGKTPHRDELEVGFFMNDKAEGRSEKLGEINLPMFIGFKFATIVTMTLSIMTALVVKALAVAKLALITSTIMLVSKILHQEEPHHHHATPAYVEIEQHASEHHPVVDYPSAGAAYHPSGSANYYAYSNYGPSGIGAENAINYATVDAAATNASIAGTQPLAAVAASKRRDFTRRKYKSPVLTVHRYSIQT